MNRSLFAALLLSTLPLPQAIAAAPVDFASQIEPILKARCIRCHGEKESQSGLRVDSAAALTRGGDRGPAFVPRHSEKSILIQALLGQNDITAMPAEGPRLKPAEIALFRRWIDEGATLPAQQKGAATVKKHWAYEPVRRPAVPAVKNQNWLRTPIDAFILARLESAHLAPSPEADRPTLIRRLSLDLRGVPPRPEEVAAFLADRAPGAYERLVDRMLASPAYGERWGRHWLDQARYADSNGFTIDSPRSIWKYRDWVISAINEDLPFDRFSIDQLAGDLLPRPTDGEVVATGFHRNTLINEEGGTDKEQFRVEAVVDRVNTTGSVFLGLTVGCAQCHQHKFDPISQRDYYNLYAIFNNCDEPIFQVVGRDESKRLAELNREIARAEKPLAAHDRKRAAAQPEWERRIAKEPLVPWTVLDPSAVRSEKGTQLNELPDRSLVVDFSVPSNDVFHVEADVPLETITAIRLETLTHNSLPNMGPGRSDGAGNFVLSEFELRARPLKSSDRTSAAWTPIPLVEADADHAQEGYPASHAIDGNRATGWSIGTKAGNKVGVVNVDRELIVFPEKPIHHRGGSRIEVVLRHDHTEPNFLIGRLRLSAASGSVESLRIPNSIRRVAKADAAGRNKAQRGDLRSAYQESDRTRAPLAARVADLKSQREVLSKKVPTTLVLKERKEPRESHVMIRGDFLRPGAVVTGGVPEFLPGLPANVKRPSRLDFAKWLFDPANPLTARVTVNRFWQHFFGTGLVDTENDFGSQGSLPTHPELLDWLASEFQSRHWGRKGLHRLIVTSAVYRQSSTVREDLLQHDPANRLLARQSRLRLEAETIRDAALTVSGLLCGKIGGPSVYPPQPEGLFVVTQQKKAWPESHGADRFRRGMYTYYWRSSPYPMLPTFDAPEANTTCTRRNRSNTPLQALTLANDRVFVEIAQALANCILRDGGKDLGAQVRTAFVRALSRQPTEMEQARLVRFLTMQREESAKKGASAEVADRTMWTAGARVLLNLDEFITRE